MKHEFSPRTQRGAAATWVFGGFAAAALFFLLTEHRAHLYGWLPFLLFAACPLMHLFHHHGGHGHGDHGQPRAGDEPRRRDESAPADGAKPTDTAALPVAHHPH